MRFVASREEMKGSTPRVAMVARTMCLGARCSGTTAASRSRRVMGWSGANSSRRSSPQGLPWRASAAMASAIPPPESGATRFVICS